jgi:ring-1,2-phenylacetyl-CoA epoxidase subunit PaaC
VVQTRLAAVIAEATLELPQARPAVSRGREGIHTEHLGYLLAEMQHLTRSHPGATW